MPFANQLPVNVTGNVPPVNGKIHAQAHKKRQKKLDRPEGPVLAE